MSADDGDEYDITSLLEDSKKQKKWRKRVEKAEVNYREGYLLARHVCGFDGFPSIEYNVDRTRQNAGHDIQISELRDLFSCILLDQPSSVKGFKIANKGFFRFILMIHVEGVEDGRSFLHRLKFSDVYRLRVSKERETMSYLPYKLLTYSTDDESQFLASPKLPEELDSSSSSASSLFRRMQTYVLSPGQRRLWNYPQVIYRESSATLNGQLDESISGKRMPELSRETSDSKRARPLCASDAEIIEIPQDGPRAVSTSALLSTIDEAAAILSSSPEFGPLEVSYYSDFPVNQQLVVERDYCQTVSRDSAAFAQLFPAGGKQRKPVQIAAIDCEMCDTTVGNEVVRVTVLTLPLDEEMNGEDDPRDEAAEEMQEIYKGHPVLLDCFVRPRGAVLNYRTEFSGVDESTLEGVTTTLAQVQVALLRLIARETVLVGHSVDSDLRALHIHHPQCIDTALLFPHSKGFPLRRKLRHLALDCLNLTIQSTKESSSRGHDSREDAFAALQLVLAKVEKGEKFGPRFTSRRSILRHYSERKIQSYLLSSSSAAAPGAASIISKAMDDDVSITGEDGSDTVSLSNKSNTEEIKLVNMVSRSTGKGFHYGLEDCIDGESRMAHIQKDGLCEALRSYLNLARARSDLDVEAERKNWKSLSDVANYANQVDPLTLVALALPVDEEDPFGIATIESIQKIKTELRDKVGRHGLLAVTTQNSVRGAQELLQRKKASLNSMSVFTWNGAKEKDLKSAIASVNLGYVAFSVV